MTHLEEQINSWEADQDYLLVGREGDPDNDDVSVDELKRLLHNHNTMRDQLILIRDTMDKYPNDVLKSWIYRVVASTLMVVNAGEE